MGVGMFFVQNVILAVVDLLAIVLNLYFWVVIVAAVLSWVPIPTTLWCARCAP